MSPKNAILILVIIACVSSIFLLFLFKTVHFNEKIPAHQVLTGEDLENKKVDNKATSSIRQKSLDAMENMRQNNPITEESRQKALDAMENMQNNQ